MIACRFETAQLREQVSLDELAETYHSLGLSLGKKGDLDGAVDMFARALGIRPDYAKAWNNLGVARKGLGDVSSAIENFRQAIQLSPDYVEAHWNLAFLLLLVGAFEEGWEEYEWRLGKKEWSGNLKELKMIPRWDGSPFQGKRLLVYGEQGFGDAIQFARYLTRVKALGGTVVLKAQPALADLLSTVRGVDRLIVQQPDVPLEKAFELHIPMLSLPGIFKTTLETIPADVPYIQADPRVQADWRKRLDRAHLCIGLVWAGSPGHKDDHNRSCPLEIFEPLSRIPWIRLYSLQKDAGRASETLMKRLCITDLGASLTDFSVTAGIIANLDLIISVDTAVAHLAGAMGKPVFTLIPFAPDWRWLLGREDSPWYPTMRLFRQHVRGKWHDILNHLIEEVRALNRLQLSKTGLQIVGHQENSPHKVDDLEPPVKEMIDSVIRFHQLGRIQEAQELSERILVRVPGNWEAFHLLTILYHQTGQISRFDGLLREASNLKDGAGPLLISLGNLLKELGHLKEALAFYQNALRCGPESGDLHYRIGNILQAKGELEEAISSYVKAVEMQPDHFNAFFHMGHAFNEIGQSKKALSCYRKTLEIKPDHMEATHGAGLILKDMRRFDDAVSWYQNALHFYPNSAELHYNLANVFKENGRLQKAVSSYQEAIRLNPQMVDAHYNMGNALKEARCLTQAVACYEKVLELAPDHFGAMNNMGLAYRDQADMETAIDLFDRALRIQPDHVEIRWNRALALLLNGNFAEGWEEYDLRFKRDDLRTTYPRQFDRPRWDGSLFEHKRLLVHHEQGFGDTLQFVRYLPMVKERGGVVILEVDESLHALCQGLSGVDEIVSKPLHEALDVEFDLYIPLMSLPRIFDTTLKTVPAPTPYIQADPDSEALWRTRLDAACWRIGLVWAGNPGHKDDRNRSCALETLEPLSCVPGIRLYGLQKHTGPTAKAVMERLGITDLGASLTDFSVTAGVIANLDLIISVDTAVAHLAGAMGKPVWLLLPFVPDWRWLLNRKDSPWYPSMRLFRQAQAGDWAGVIDRVADELKRLAAK